MHNSGRIKCLIAFLFELCTHLGFDTEDPNVEDRGGLWEYVGEKEAFADVKMVPLSRSAAHI